MSLPQPDILLVEDDVRLADLVKEYLEQQAFRVHVEGRGDTAVQRIRAEQPDLVILDLMLPGLDGMDVCRQVRPDFTNPILILTARDEDIDEVLGLELGADDYVVKPVKPRVLLARVRNLLRRRDNGTATREGLLRVGDLVIDPHRRSVILADQPLSLTTQEFDLLHLLAGKPGTVWSRDDILGALSGLEYDGLDRSVDIRIARLRKLLGDDPIRPRFIRTVRGKGYLFIS